MVVIGHDGLVIAHLTEWGHWRKTANKTGPKGMRSWWFPIVMRGKIKQQRDWDRIDCNEERCLGTEAAVHALPDELREAVFQHYVEGGSIAQQVAACRLYSKTTLYARLDEAHRLMLGLLNDVAAGIKPHV